MKMRFSVFGAHSGSFDRLLRQHMEESWHLVSARSKQIFRDVTVLRKLLSYLVSYDSVTFNTFLETILASNAMTAKSVFKNDLSSPWLMLDSAHTVFEKARERVYRKSNKRTSDADNQLIDGN
jgi:DNA excision repair protein ERCC-4